MSRYGKEILLRLTLVSGSILIALVFAEIGIRLFVPTGAGDYLSRYLIDGNPSPSLDYYIGDPQLPFVLKPGYKSTLVDLAWHPVPFDVTLDSFGYRNQTDESNEFGLTVLGDSVAFGYGVNDDETIAAHLEKQTKSYSLAIPNAGPEMYMVMLERFLKRARTKRIAVLFYAGNDYKNLRDAYWKSLGSCSIPGESRILRLDQPVLNHDQGMKSSPLVVVGLVIDIARRYFGSGSPEPCQLLGEYSQVSAAAITDLDNFENYEQKLEDNSPRALSYLQQLAAASCVGEIAKGDIAAVIRMIRDKSTEGLSSRMQKVSVGLAEKNCYPTGSGYPEEKAGRNLSVYANYYAGFYYDYLSNIGRGRFGNLYNFQAHLDKVVRVHEMSSQFDNIAALKKY